jgi:hypothetical protein
MGLAGYLVGPGSGELDLVLLAVSRNWTLMNLPSLSQSMLNRGEREPVTQLSEDELSHQ